MLDADENLGKLLESEALTLHSMMTSMPYFILMKPNTLEVIQRIWLFRETTNHPVYFTLDAGANVHVLYPESHKRVNNEVYRYRAKNTLRIVVIFVIKLD